VSSQINRGVRLRPEFQMRIKAVVLDMDGLMLDTEPLYKCAADRQRAAAVLTLAGKLRSL